jgi:hypothetical protein
MSGFGIAGATAVLFKTELILLLVLLLSVRLPIAAECDGFNAIPAIQDPSVLRLFVLDLSLEFTLLVRDLGSLESNDEDKS